MFLVTSPLSQGGGFLNKEFVMGYEHSKAKGKRPEPGKIPTPGKDAKKKK